MSRVPLLLALVLFVSITVTAQSQANTGNIEGRVTDPNAASVPNVTVTATNLATGLQKNAVTNDEGVYRIVFLLFAEARALVPVWHPVYRESYSVESLRQTAEPDRKQEERQPVADHFEADQGRRMELLPEHPVRDDVFVVVGHHRESGDKEVWAGVAIPQPGEAPRHFGIGRRYGIRHGSDSLRVVVARKG